MLLFTFFLVKCSFFLTEYSVKEIVSSERYFICQTLWGRSAIWMEYGSSTRQGLPPHENKNIKLCGCFAPVCSFFASLNNFATLLWSFWFFSWLFCVFVLILCIFTVVWCLFYHHFVSICCCWSLVVFCTSLLFCVYLSPPFVFLWYFCISLWLFCVSLSSYSVSLLLFCISLSSFCNPFSQLATYCSLVRTAWHHFLKLGETLQHLLATGLSSNFIKLRHPCQCCSKKSKDWWGSGVSCGSLRRLSVRRPGFQSQWKLTIFS